MASCWAICLHQCQVHRLWHKRLRVQADRQREALLLMVCCRRVGFPLSPRIFLSFHPPQVEPNTFYWFVLAPVSATSPPPKLRVNVALYL